MGPNKVWARPNLRVYRQSNDEPGTLQGLTKADHATILWDTGETTEEHLRNLWTRSER
jgi:hypothetical protein